MIRGARISGVKPAPLSPDTSSYIAERHLAPWRATSPTESFEMVRDLHPALPKLERAGIWQRPPGISAQQVFRRVAEQRPGAEPRLPTVRSVWPERPVRPAKVAQFAERLALIP